MIIGKVIMTIIAIYILNNHKVLCQDYRWVNCGHKAMKYLSQDSNSNLSEPQPSANKHY